jgi:hypothetical protein
MKKNEADNCVRIEIWWLLRDIKDGYKYSSVSWGENGSYGSINVEVSLNNTEKYARFIYTQANGSGEEKNFDYKVKIIQTPCRFGGYRYWFKCPLNKSNQCCGRRIAVLYKDGDYFGCRHCHELTYRSRNVNKRARHYPMLRVIELNEKIKKYEENIKRETYNGRLTKKQQRVLKLHAQSMGNFRDFQMTEKGLNFHKKGRIV